MTIAMVSRTIQLILAPVVMITSCAILLGGLLQRYAAINDRLRTMMHERFELIRGVDATPHAPKSTASDRLLEERLQQIDYQTPDLLKRHRLIHHAVLATYCGVAIFVGDMIVIAIAADANAPWIATAALIIFLVGTLLLFLSVMYAAIEVRTSQNAVAYEVQRISQLKPD